MNKSQLAKTALFLYQYARSCFQNNNIIKINTQTTAAYLDLGYATFHRHLSQLMNLGLITKQEEKSRRDVNGDVCQKWASPVFDVDFEAYQKYLTKQNIVVPEDGLCFIEFGKYCSFSHEFSLVKAEQPKVIKEVSQEVKQEVTSVIRSIKDIAKEATKRVEKKAANKEYRLSKRLAHLQDIINANDELEYLNSINTEYQISFVKELNQRATTKFCHTPNPEKRKDQTRIIEAKRFLNADNVSHYDVSSSIYKTAKGLGTNRVPNLKEDVYRTVMNATHLLDHDLTDKEWSEIRSDVKTALFMSTFMKEGSVYFRTVKQRELGIKVKDRTTGKERKEPSLRWKYNHNQLNESDKKLFEAEERLVEFFKNHEAVYQDADNVIYFSSYNSEDGLFYYLNWAVKKAMRNIFSLKKFFGKEIFYYESVIYLKVQAILKKEYNIDTLAVYDCFYYDAKHTDFEEIFTAVYQRVFKEVLNTISLQKEMLKYRDETPRIIAAYKIIDPLKEKTVAMYSDCRNMSYELPKGERITEEQRDYFIKRALSNPEQYCF